MLVQFPAGTLYFSGKEAIQLTELVAYGMLVVPLKCLLIPEIIKKEDLRSSSTSKAGKLPYDLYCVSVTLNSTNNLY
jgi:hypothetical protein